MDSIKEVTLPSGAVLKIGLAPFEDSKNLYQAFMEEAKSIKIEGEAQIGDLCKNILCYGFSSKRIEACLTKCMARALYNGEKITGETFEPAERRQDYLEVLYSVAEENISPFTKNLYAKFSQVLEKLGQAHA